MDPSEKRFYYPADAKECFQLRTQLWRHHATQAAYSEDMQIAQVD